ncbi:TOPRS ligase, partial [Alopecoenas beccarii]|nr:TOPRS ligase [Alopecoenas beccarii]
MAAESQWSCPICCDDGEDIAYISPCLHQICVGCAMRWVRQKANCPLCRSRTTANLFSRLSDDDYLMFDVPRTAESSDEDDEDQHGAARPVPRPEVGGFPPEVWADFFKSHPNNTRPLLPWLRGELEALAENEWWEVDATEATVVAHLCLWGLDEEALVRQLQDNVPEDTRTFVRQLIAAAVHLCGREIRLHLGQQDPHAEWGEDDSSASSASPTASRGGTPAPHTPCFGSHAGSDVEEQPSTSEAALHWGLSCPPNVPVPEEQQQPQEEPGQAVAGPSAQGCSPSRSAPGRGGTRPPGGPRRPPKRRNPSPPDSPPPCKRPPRRRR